MATLRTTRTKAIVILTPFIVDCILSVERFKTISLRREKRFVGKQMVSSEHAPFRSKVAQPVHAAGRNRR
jgi:hypothetical protein